MMANSHSGKQAMDQMGHSSGLLTVPLAWVTATQSSLLESASLLENRALVLGSRNHWVIGAVLVTPHVAGLEQGVHPSFYHPFSHARVGVQSGPHCIGEEEWPMATSAWPRLRSCCLTTCSSHRLRVGCPC